jgi:hypothetical protein
MVTSATIQYAALEIDRERPAAARVLLEACRREVQPNPGLAIVWTIMNAHVDALEGAVDAARVALSSAARDIATVADPKVRRAALRTIGVAWMACGDLEAARTALKARMEDGNVGAGALPELLLALARCERGLGNAEESRKLLERGASCVSDAYHVAASRAELEAS